MKKIILHLANLVTNAKLAIDQATNCNILDDIRVEYLGKKGHFSIQMEVLRTLPIKDRPTIGNIINQSKKQIQQALNLRKENLRHIALHAKLISETIDVSLPGRRIENGYQHPITRTIERVENFFSEIGFCLVDSLEIEDSYHNFDALNIPHNHPARTDNDTFWFDDKRLLRTQTSGIQIHIMKAKQPPIQIITSGRVYRHDFDRTHTPMFHQIEGFIIDNKISFTNLKSILYDFLYNFFEKNMIIRLRPSYFPFTEPSAEIDITDQHGKWLEVLGCGMIHPNVLHNVGINPEIYSGFAFGMGVERLTMLRYGITDPRMFFENDLRFLKQFK